MTLVLIVQKIKFSLQLKNQGVKAFKLVLGWHADSKNLHNSADTTEVPQLQYHTEVILMGEAFYMSSTFFPL